MSYPRCGYGFEREVIFEPKVPSETTARALARLLAAVPNTTSFKAGTDAPLSAAVWAALGALPALTHLEAECPREKHSELSMYNDKIASLVEALDGGGFQKLKVLTIRGQPFQPQMLAKLAPKLPRGPRDAGAAPAECAGAAQRSGARLRPRAGGGAGRVALSLPLLAREQPRRAMTQIKSARRRPTAPPRRSSPQTRVDRATARRTVCRASFAARRRA